MRQKLILAIGILAIFISLCFAAWDNTKPADSDAWNDAAGFIRANNDALEVALGVDLANITNYTDQHNADGTHSDITTTGPVVDARAFMPSNFVGDGSIDVTLELQAAIDASEWKSLYLPRGKYKITSALELDGEKGYNIFGDGWDIRNSNEGSIIKNAGTGNAINITTAGTGTGSVDQEFNMVHLSNFMLLGTFSPTPSGIGIQTRNVHNLFLDRMVIKSHGQSGIQNTNAFGFKITNSIVSLNGNHGISLNKRANNVVIQGCIIDSNARNDGEFANLKIVSNGVAGEDENLGVLIIGNEIALIENAAFTAHNVVIGETLSLTFIGNYVETNISDGFLFTASSTCRNIVVDGNYFQDGKFLMNKCLKSRVTNNTFRVVDTATSMTITADAGDGNTIVRGNRLVNGATEVFNDFVPFPRGQLGDAGSEVWTDVPDVPAGTSLDRDITVTGVALGDIALASLEIDLGGLILTAAVTAANTVTVTLTNSTVAGINLAGSPVINVRVFQIVQSDDP